MTRSKPRLLLVNRDRHPWPLDRARQRKYDALAEVVELRVLGSGVSHVDARFRLFPPRRFADVALLPGRVLQELRRFRPDAVFVQGVHEAGGVLVARRLARVPAKVILDVQGDWRAVRFYGSHRRALAEVSARLAPLVVRHTDAVRTVSAATTDLVRSVGVDAAATFPAYVDEETFGAAAVPLPLEPRAVFIGSLESIKGVDVLLEAWPKVGVGALHLVGDGALRAQVTVCYKAGQVQWAPRLAPEEVSRALDEAWCLVLPSRSEGMPRVVLEAFARGRGVVGARVGGIPELVEDGVGGVLVDAEDVDGLAEALRRVLSDRALAERLGEGAARAADRWVVTPEEWARNVRELVDRTLVD